MKRKTLLKKIFVFGMAASLALNSASGVFAVENTEIAAEDVVEEAEKVAIVSFAGIGTIEVPLGTTTDMPEYPVEEGKKFVGWQLNGGTVYAAGEKVTLSAEIGAEAFGKYAFVFTALVEDAEPPVEVENVGIVSFTGIGTTEVSLGTTTDMPAWTGEVPEGKVFAGWTLNGGETVYAVGETIELSAANGAVAFGKYAFAFEPYFTDAPVEEVENVGLVSFTGIGTTEVDLPITTDMPAWTGEVPEGKEFAGWTLNQGTDVYAAGTKVELSAANGAVAFGKYAFAFEPSFTDVKVEEVENKGIVSFEGIKGAMTEVDLPITTDMPAWTGEVPAGKVFAGWSLNGGTDVYAAGATVELSAANGAVAFGKYAFAFAPVFEEVENKGIVSFDGIEGAMTEVDLPITTDMPAWTGEVPAGKVFAGWTLNGGADVYAEGATVELSAANGDVAFGKYAFVFEPFFADVEVENKGIVSFDGIEGAMTEVDLPITTDMPAWTGEVPAGKVFTGWTLNGGTDVYAAGTKVELSAVNGAVAFGKYAFVFEPAFETVENKGIVSFDGIEGAMTEVDLPITTDMPAWPGEVPAGKVFAGWTLNGGADVYAEGETVKLSTENGEVAFGKYAFVFEPFFADVQVENRGIVSFDGIEGAVTEVDLPITTDMPAWPGEVPAGKVFTGWTLNGGTDVYAAGTKVELSAVNGAVAFGKYAFVFEPAFEAVEERAIVSFVGIEGAVTEVDLPITTDMPAWTGEVPEGKVFAGWTLNQGTDVYAEGETVKLSTANGAVAFGKYAFVFEPYFTDVEVENRGIVSFVGIEGAVTEVDLPITTDMPAWNGEVPEGKVFAGWTLNQGADVYAEGETVKLSAENGAVAFGKYAFVFEPYFADVQVENRGIVSFVGIEGAVTEVDLPITTDMPAWPGEVPEGKVFAGWTLNRGDEVYAEGTTVELSTENGDVAFGKYAFVFEASFEDEEPTTEEPDTEPATEPTTEEPATEPTTEEPTTEEPVTEEPETEETTEEDTEDDTEAPATEDKKNDSGKKDDTTKSTEKQDTAVKTGDNTMVVPYVILLVVAAACMVLVFLKKRKAF